MRGVHEIEQIAPQPTATVGSHPEPFDCHSCFTIESSSPKKARRPRGAHSPPREHDRPEPWPL